MLSSAPPPTLQCGCAEVEGVQLCCAKQQPKCTCMAKTVMWAPAEAPMDGAGSVQQAKRLSLERTRKPSCHGNRRETVLEARRLNASRHNSKQADAVNHCGTHDLGF